MQESTVLDNLDLASTRAKSMKPKGKGKRKNKTAKARTMNQKIRYVFNRSVRSSLQYLDYFKPDDREVEDRLVTLSDIAVCIRARAHTLLYLFFYIGPCRSC